MAYYAGRITEEDKAKMRDKMIRRHRARRSAAARKPEQIQPWVAARRAYKRFGFQRDRVDARFEGQQFYFTGKHCRAGHYGPRFTLNGRCAICAGHKQFPVFKVGEVYWPTDPGF